MRGIIGLAVFFVWTAIFIVMFMLILSAAAALYLAIGNYAFGVFGLLTSAVLYLLARHYRQGVTK